MSRLVEGFKGADEMIENAKENKKKAEETVGNDKDGERYEREEN